ncbi:MAG: hypothetical protein JW902_05990 [Syntrophaceae bacterium]|nr:hypothetical protein [Syntrophaceae bacterium]
MLEDVFSLILSLIEEIIKIIKRVKSVENITEKTCLIYAGNVVNSDGESGIDQNAGYSRLNTLL